MTVPYDEKLTNTVTPPTVHGGIAATLVDTAGGIALRTLLDDPLSEGVATVNLNVNYLRRAAGDLTATAEVVRAGSTIGWSTVTVESPTPEGNTEAVAVGGPPTGCSAPEPRRCRSRVVRPRESAVAPTGMSEPGRLLTKRIQLF